MHTFANLLAVALAAVAAVAASAQSDQVATSPSDEAQVRELETMSWVAWKAHDGAFFDRFLSDDHVEVHGYGITGKQAVVDGVRSGACVVQSYSLDRLSVTRVASESLLVTYRAEQNTICGSARVPSPVWATSLYVKRSGKWLNVLYQHTPAT